MAAILAVLFASGVAIAQTPTPSEVLNLLSGSYANCTNGTGRGCAKGDYRFVNDGTTSVNSFTITAPDLEACDGGSVPCPAGQTTDVGKHGVALQYDGPSAPSTVFAGWAGYLGVSCPFVVTAVNSPTSITVRSLATGTYSCGDSGVNFTDLGNAYTAIYTDDTAAVQNAVSRAASAGQTLLVPSNYVGGIYSAVVPPGNANIQCESGGTFYNPNFGSSSHSSIFQIQADGDSITGCNFRGTNRPNAALFDVERIFDDAVDVYHTNKFSFQGNDVENIWTCAAGVNISGRPAQNITVTSNTFKNCACNGVQIDQGNNNMITNNYVEDCGLDLEAGLGDLNANINGNSISFNTIKTVNGDGYSRVLSSLGLGNLGGALLSCGAAPQQAGLYVGNSCNNNSVSGPTSNIIYAPITGVTLQNNSCTNGCAVHTF